MIFGIVDAIIIIIILYCATMGARNGFFKQVVFLVGTLICFILGFYLKDYLANFLSYNLPFFKFGGLTSLNILLYQALAFIIISSILGLILGIALKVANVFEKILKATVILSIPSKILGFILGIIEGYVVVFILSFILTQPFVNLDIVNDSKFVNVIASSSPGLSNVVETTNDTGKEIYSLIDKYNTNKDKDKFNKDAIDIMLENKIITKEYIETLKEKDKI